jgi:hypothetical protein
MKPTAGAKWAYSRRPYRRFMLRSPSTGTASGTSAPANLRSSRQKAAGVVTMMGCLGILLAACSSASAGASGTTSTTTAASGRAGFTAYFNCLKSHGVTLDLGGRGGFGGPPGSTPPSDVTTTTMSATQRAAFEKAASDCASLRPKFNGGSGANNTAFAAYRNGLKLHGVTLPTRGAGGFGGFGGSGSSTSTSTTASPTVQAAMNACASLRPKGGPGGFGGGFPGGSTTTTG